MLRKIGALVAGVVVLGVVVVVLQRLGSTLYPLPPGLDPLDPADAEAFASHLATLPVTAWVIAFGSELVGAMLGAYVAARVVVNHKAVFASVIVALAVAGSISNWVAFPHPPWFVVGQILAYPLGLAAVVRLVADATTATVEEQ